MLHRRYTQPAPSPAMRRFKSRMCYATLGALAVSGIFATLFVSFSKPGRRRLPGTECLTEDANVTLDTRLDALLQPAMESYEAEMTALLESRPRLRQRIQSLQNKLNEACPGWNHYCEICSLNGEHEVTIFDKDGTQKTMKIKCTGEHAKNTTNVTEIVEKVSDESESPPCYSCKALGADYPDKNVKCTVCQQTEQRKTQERGMLQRLGVMVESPKRATVMEDTISKWKNGISELQGEINDVNLKIDALHKKMQDRLNAARKNAAAAPEDAAKPKASKFARVKPSKNNQQSY